MDMMITIGQALLGGIVLLLGLGTLARSSTTESVLGSFGGRQWLRLLSGTLLLLGGGALLASIWIPPLAAFAGIVLAVLMIAIGGANFLRSGPRRRWLVPAVLLLAALGISYSRPLGLQLVALTQPDVLPTMTVPSQALATYAPDAFLESVVLDRQGNLYFTRTTGADFTTFDLSRARGEIVKRTPDGAETIFAALPDGAVAGVLTIVGDDTLYVTVSAPTRQDAHGVWRFGLDGQGQLFATLPPETGPNGITPGPDNNLYVADSNLGAVWRINPATGAVRQWVRHAQLARRPWLGLFPGANGLHFWQNDLYVAVSDRGQLVRVPLLPDGEAGELVVFVRGVPTDDFAFDAQGNLYATTHPFDTIVRVTPDGRRTVIATAAEGIVGPTAVAFGTLPGDETSLYVVTDGGLFAQRADPRPTLLRLDIPVTGAARLR